MEVEGLEGRGLEREGYYFVHSLCRTYKKRIYFTVPPAGKFSRIFFNQAFFADFL
jgi:hypothetical protein